MRTLIIVIFAVLLVGCANTTQRYGISTENNQILRGIESPHQIKVGVFTSSGPNSATINCRSVRPLIVPSSSYESYIREALIDELKLSGLYSDTASTELTMHFEKIDFSSALTGNWVISAQFAVAGKSSFTITSNYGIPDVNFGPDLACSNTASAFVPAVQNFLKTLFLDPRFKEAILGSGNSKSASTTR
ncbi:MAG: hypothetical protein K2P67_05070 [Gallionellaceae bacterium]|jgi:hypothetical protein|nr:hypothetical protein [Gallionellaceae bacterium]